MNMKSIFLVWKDKNCNGENPECEYSAKDEHPDRFELNSAAAQIEQSNRRN